MPKKSSTQPPAASARTEYGGAKRAEVGEKAKRDAVEADERIDRTISEQEEAEQQAYLEECFGGPAGREPGWDQDGMAEDELRRRLSRRPGASPAAGDRIGLLKKVESLTVEVRRLVLEQAALAAEVALLGVALEAERKAHALTAAACESYRAEVEHRRTEAHERENRRPGRPAKKIDRNEVVRKKSEGWSVVALAREFGISRPTVYRLLKDKGSKRSTTGNRS